MKPYRPFDDLGDEKVRLESEAVLSVVAYCEQKKLILLGSDVLYDEIERISDIVKRQRVMALYSSAVSTIELNDIIITRAKELHASGFASFDALHIASEEYGSVDIFLTTDRKLLNLAKKTALKLNVLNPAVWLVEVLYNDK